MKELPKLDKDTLDQIRLESTLEAIDAARARIRTPGLTEEEIDEIIENFWKEIPK